MNFEKIINFFRRPGQAIRKKFAGFRSKKGEKSLGEGKLVTESKKSLPASILKKEINL